MRENKRAFTLAVFTLALATLVGSFAFLESVDAQRRRRGRGGGIRAQVYVTQNRIPSRMRSERALIGFARRNRARNLRERTDITNIAERRWEADMVVAFNRPIGDMQFTAVFYQLIDGARKFIAPSLDIMVTGRDEKTFVNRIRLERPHFEPNERTEVVITVRRREVGRARFNVVGEHVRHSGEVNF